MAMTRRAFLGLLGPGAALLLAACSGGATSASLATGGQLIAKPSENQWPDLFWKSPADVQEAYRYALANPDVLQYFPCFCGCVNQGHTSNKDCYIQQARPDGSFLLEPMSFG
jgi:hypothetical protein